MLRNSPLIILFFLSRFSLRFDWSSGMNWQMDATNKTRINNDSKPIKVYFLWRQCSLPLSYRLVVTH